MWNNTNPTSLYLGTTWELISAGKYVKTGDRALQFGGSNSITLTKDNLPNIKLKVDSFSLTTNPHNHNFDGFVAGNDTANMGGGNRTVSPKTKTTANASVTTNTAQPQTETLGNGNAITIQPEFITLKFWKRTS